MAVTAARGSTTSPGARPTLTMERALRDEVAAQSIAGLDEAGRGALAGPVVAAAVILPLDDPQRLAALAGVNDSKKLTARRREALYDQIVANAVAWGVGASPPATIDDIGIIPANVLAMEAALAELSLPADYLLIDGRMRLRRLNIRQQAVVRGDQRSLSIAAASIIAKVTRDRLMVDLDGRYPLYGFAQHKGYCTRRHEKALLRHGPCPEHRYSFAPIRQTLV